jgi:hypothetical protein
LERAIGTTARTPKKNKENKRFFLKNEAKTVCRAGWAKWIGRLAVSQSHGGLVSVRTGSHTPT